MTTKTNHRGLAALTLAALIGLPSTGALADTTRDEIRLLKARLHQLEQREAARDREARAPKVHGSNAMVVHADDGHLPDRIYFKGVSVKPGGYFAMETVYRQHWQGSDMGTGWAATPLGLTATGQPAETRFSARASRQSLLFEADLDPVALITKGPPAPAGARIQGYLETDFQGAAQTANSNSTNSYNLRMRQIWTNIDWANLWGLGGVHFTAGQMWTLGTTNSGPIRVDNFVTPPTIDQTYLPGFYFARQPGFRITKDLPWDITAAFAVEGSSTVWATNGTPLAGLPGTPITALLPAACGGATVACATPILGGAPFGGSTFNSANGYSFNRLPDFVGKVAWDPTFFDRHIHVEGFGVLRDFDERFYWGNHSVWAGGGGGSVIVPILPKLVDFQASGAIGAGIGRFGAGSSGAAGGFGGINGWDATYGLSGNIIPIHTRMLLLGVTVHALPTTDIYAFAGGEFNGQNNAQYGWWKVGASPTLFVSGFGSYLNNNAGCEIEAPSNYGLTNPTSLVTTCANQTKMVRQVTTGIWHTLYAGDFGKVKVGAQYAYTVRDLTAGIGGQPRGTNNAFYTSFRWYPF